MSKQLLEAFFKRALAWENGDKEGQDEGGFSLSQEKDGIYLFQSDQEIGIMLEGHATKLPFGQIRSIAPGIKGFDLILIKLDKVRKFT